MARRGPQGKSPLASKVGRRVRALREHQAITPAELARRAQTSRSVVHGIEAGTRAPALDTLQALARALGEPLANFFKDADGESRGRPMTPVLARTIAKLRERDADYLDAVEDFLKWLDRHYSPPGGKRR